MSEPRTESQEQGSATLSKEQIELIGTILEPRFEKVEDRFDRVIAEMRLIAKEEGEKVRDAMDTTVKETRNAMDTAVKELRKELKDEVRDQIKTQTKHFYGIVTLLAGLWIAAASIAVSQWPESTPVAPAAPVAQAAPATPDEPPGLSQP